MIIGSPEKNTKSMEPVLFIENAGAALRYNCYFKLLKNMFVVLDIQVLGSALYVLWLIDIPAAITASPCFYGLTMRTACVFLPGV